MENNQQNDKELFREWAAKVSGIVRRINEKLNLTRQQTNHVCDRVDKIENALIRMDQRLDRLSNNLTRLESGENTAKDLEKQLGYFRVKAALIRKTPGGAYVWIIIDSLPAIILSVLIFEFVHSYGYHALLKRVIDYILFK